MSTDTFLTRYLQYTATHESPDEFHLWCAITAAGFALGRTCYVDMVFYTVYPNFYTILVAGSGACRKGGALNVARDLINASLSDREDRRFLPGKIYPEALVQVLANRVTDPFNPSLKVQRAVLLCAPELGAFMSKHMQQVGMPDLLMELHDCPDKHEYVTKNSGSDLLKHVFLAFLGGTTPTWMQHNMNLSMLSEGYIARSLLIYGAQPKLRNPRPQRTRELAELRQWLIQDLKDLAAIRGPFVLSPEAEILWDDWYKNYTTHNDIAEESGFAHREHTHVLRTALVFAACAKTDRIIHAPHIQAAINLVQQVRLSMHIPLMGANTEPDQRGKQKVLHTIKTHGGRHGIALQELCRRLFNHMSPDQICDWLTALKTTGVIEARTLTASGGEKHIFYRSLDYRGNVSRYNDIKPDLTALEDDPPSFGMGQE